MRLMLILASVLISSSVVGAQPIEPPANPERPFARSIPDFETPQSLGPNAVGTLPEHKIPAGNEVAPGRTPSCQQFWATAPRNFETKRTDWLSPQGPNAARWWRTTWERFHVMCDGEVAPPPAAAAAPERIPRLPQ